MTKHIDHDEALYSEPDNYCDCQVHPLPNCNSDIDKPSSVIAHPADVCHPNTHVSHLHCPHLTPYTSYSEITYTFTPIAGLTSYSYALSAITGKEPRSCPTHVTTVPGLGPSGTCTFNTDTCSYEDCTATTSMFLSCPLLSTDPCCTNTKTTTIYEVSYPRSPLLWFMIREISIRLGSPRTELMWFLNRDVQRVVRRGVVQQLRLRFIRLVRRFHLQALRMPEGVLGQCWLSSEDNWRGEMFSVNNMELDISTNEWESEL